MCTFKAFGDFKVSGRENVPKDVPIILVSNHLSIIDPPLCANAVGKEPRFLAKRELFKFPSNILLKYYGAFSINRGFTDIKAFNWSKQQLKGNKSLLVFPEGTRSNDGKLKQGYNGAIILALATESILLPVSVTGTENCKNFLQFLYPKMKVRITIGNPFTLHNVPEDRNKTFIKSATSEMMMRIANILPEKYKFNKEIYKEKNFIYTKKI
jgi:1-acyl-sn-glycerol-3-phosphate acyltransferase